MVVLATGVGSAGPPPNGAPREAQGVRLPHGGLRPVTDAPPMSTRTTHLIPHCATRANVSLDERLRGSALKQMDLKTYKAVKNGLLSLFLLVFAGFLVLEGADPTLVFTGTVAFLALLNGVELGEFYSAWEEVRRVQAQNTADPDRKKS